MAAGRTMRSLVGRRRRVGEDGEEDEGPVIVDDSQSEGSILSDMDDDDASSLVGVGEEATGVAAANAQAGDAVGSLAKAAKKARKPRKTKAKEQAKEHSVEMTDQEHAQSSFKMLADTQAMMKGLRIDEQAQTQATVDFENMQDAVPGASAPRSPINGSPHNETPVQRQRREHEEYRRKRDADPAFVPNRGNFFMHDTRGSAKGQPAQILRGGFVAKARGRGGPIVGGPFSPANKLAQAERASEQPWKHDLHDTINEEQHVTAENDSATLYNRQELEDSARLFPRNGSQQAQAPAPPRIINFSTSTLVGKVQIRVLLVGMKMPVLFSEVPWKHYVRLPNHRPPLRRDKPVRVSLPDRPPHYIFPPAERSFIFIPRQQRPSQHGYHRGSFQRSSGGMGYSSQRTSIYGGSVYAPSLAASRRSSLAGINRSDAFSPASLAGGMPPPNRPIVRLPHGAQPLSGFHTPNGQLSGQQTPLGMLQVHTYPLPQQPAFQGTPTNTVHQPRPQKAISVTGIESPVLLAQVPSNDPQPFESQLPSHISQPPVYGQVLQQQPYFSPHQQYAYPTQMQAGTPLSGIPEPALHAPSFQPPLPFGQPAYYSPYLPPQQQQFFYSPPGPDGYAPMPMYMPSPQHQQPYSVMPNLAQPIPQQLPHPPTQEPPPQASQDQASLHSSSQSGMVAHESNGMVFYIPRSEVTAQGDQAQQNYQPAEGFVPSYAMPGLPPPTPAPETSAGYYYPSLPLTGPQGIPGMGGVYYAPPSQPQ